MGRAISATAAKLARVFRWQLTHSLAERRGLPANVPLAFQSKSESFSKVSDRALQFRLLIFLLCQLWIRILGRLEIRNRFALNCQCFEFRERFRPPIVIRPEVLGPVSEIP